MSFWSDLADSFAKLFSSPTTAMAHIATGLQDVETLKAEATQTWTEIAHGEGGQQKVVTAMGNLAHLLATGAAVLASFEQPAPTPAPAPSETSPAA